jgi:hypothetical protein
MWGGRQAAKAREGKAAEKKAANAKVVSHGRYVTFQMAEVAVPGQMFQEILSLIARLRAPPAPAWPGDRVRCGRPRRQRSALIEAKQPVAALLAELLAILPGRRLGSASNLVAAHLDETDNRTQQTGNPGNVG